MKLQKVSTITIQNLIDTLTSEQGFARKSCLLVTTILKDVFRNEIKEGFVSTNPVQDLDLPKAPKVEMVIWDKDDIEVFLSIKDEKNRGKYYIAILMALLTGMRKGEILGLTWDKIDFDNNVIHIQQILESGGSKLSKKTKSKRFSQVRIPHLLKHELLLYKKKQKSTTPENPNDLVFCTSRGKRVIPNTLNDVLDSYCSKLDLPRMKFHDLRHTHATMLIKENVNIKVIQERLGHSRASTTLDIYSHVFT